MCGHIARRRPSALGAPGGMATPCALGPGSHPEAALRFLTRTWHARRTARAHCGRNTRCLRTSCSVRVHHMASARPLLA
ncbi:hypothetical protein PsYK624_061930 [Phanerochaete sordida]|uniref:Uncharacterized protein n=1 Tax=Phanerochaete sordida TaxID=48140 RepID=A0A9P3LCB4_9APHY|nr:hypothetical protein PsYK624_061930 [Phanerochaete sordida]